MALKDISNFKFFSEAIAQRFRDASLKSFRGIPYEPPTNPHSIFGRIYSTFRELIGKGINLHQYLDISKREVLENLYKNLKSDINLKFLNNPKSVLGDPRYDLQNQNYPEELPETMATQQTESAPAQTPIGTSAGGMPSLPSAPSVSPPQRIIHNIPQTPSPSGMEGGTGQGTAATNKINRLNTPSPATAASAPSPATTAPTPPSFSSSQLFNSRRFKMPERLKTFGSNAKIFARKFILRAGRRLTGATRIGLQSAAPALGQVFHGGLNGIDRIIKPRKFNRLRSLKKPGSPVAPGKSKIFLLLFGLFFVSAIAIGIFGASTNPQPGTTPGQSGTINSCKFTRSGNPQPIISSVLSDWINNAAATAGIPASVLGSIAMHENPGFVTTKGDDSPEIQTGQYCIDGSPVCVDITKNEAAYQRACTSEEEQTGTLKTARAKGLMQLLDIYNEGFPFCDLKANIQRAAEILKGKMGSGSWSNETDIKKSVCGFFGAGGDSCKYPDKTGPYDYAAEVWQDLQNCQTSSAPGANIFNCPVPDGKVSYGSKEKGEHCSPSYAQQYGSQGCNPGEAGYTGRDTAVDITGTFPSIYLPKINNKEVLWNIAESSKTIPDAEGGGEDFVATTFIEGKQYRIRFVHLESIPQELVLGSQWPSDRFIGKYYQNNPYGAHLHITIQENGVFRPADTYFNLCQ